eukprot:GHUV01007097.1.p2 GENE.GHUV01007097.1~~GHUV01007097.1.p2  ORF type:complete len:445 (+),score=134.60 GHUV01007097.1:4633-5967(+)
MMCGGQESVGHMSRTPALDQQCDMACFIVRGRRSSEDGISVKPSSLTSDAGFTQGHSQSAATKSNSIADNMVGVQDSSKVLGSGLKHAWGDRLHSSSGSTLQTQGAEPQSDSNQAGSNATGETAQQPQAGPASVAPQQRQHTVVEEDADQTGMWTVVPLDPTGAVVPVDSMVAQRMVPALSVDVAGLSISASSSSADDTTAEADSAAPSNSVFFARVPPTVPYESIHALFAQFGTVLNLNLFRPWASAKTSKGCGIVEYEGAASAVAAMDALHQKYHWTGGETTMVVEWMDPRRHRKERQGDGSGQSRAAGTRNAKNSRPKNGKHNPFNIAMALPGVANRMLPPIRTTPPQRFPSGVVPGMGWGYSNPASQQAAVMMGLGAEGLGRRGSCPGSFVGGFSSNQLLVDGSVGQLDAALLEQLGYGANMHTGGVPAQWVSGLWEGAI